MKFSAALALAIAPLALAKSVHNVYPVKREEGKQGGNSKDANQKNNNNGGNKNNAPAAVINTQTTEIIVIWANPGAGAQTTTLNQPVTVTQTVVGGAQPTQPGTASVPPGATPALAGTMQTHQVMVGGPGGLTYTPAQINAAVGDMVVFTFMSNNHTATQSGFTTPCDPMAGGMDTGFQPNPNNTVTPPPQVAMQVMVATPLWFYCRQANHCGQGMTFSINPTADKTQAMFQAMAIQQKGTGKASAITGGQAAANGTAAAPPAAAAPAAGSAAPAAGGSTGTGSVQSGTGTIQNGQCVCAVSCGAGAFPAVQAQGIGAFGGVPGALPASMVEA